MGVSICVTSIKRKFIKFPICSELRDFSISSTDESLEEPFNCQETITVQYNVIECHVGNPYPSNVDSKVTLNLDLIYVKSESPVFEGRIDQFTHKTENKEASTELSRTARGPEVK